MGEKQAVWAQGGGGVTWLTECKRWHCRTGQCHFFFPFPIFVGSTVQSSYWFFFSERVMGRRRLVLCRLKHKPFVLGTGLCYMISAMGAPRHHFPVQITSINNSC